MAANGSSACSAFADNSASEVRAAERGLGGNAPGAFYFSSVTGALMPNSLLRLSLCIASIGSLALTVGSPHAAAQSTSKIVTGADGNLYRETTQVIQRPVSKTEWDQQQQTIFRERLDTQWQTNYRTYLTPVTEYRAELYLANRWNPLAMPYWSYRYVPVTRWESRHEPYSVPITQRTLVPEQQTVQIPRTTTQIATESYTSKVYLGPATPTGSQPSMVARRESLGGTKLEGDPPRSGTWQAAGGTTVR
jgi:hypothetical protein